MSMLWSNETSLCMLLFSIVDRRQTSFMKYSVMFLVIFQMTRGVERIYLTGFLSCPVRITVVLIQPLMISELSLKRLSWL